MAGRERTEASPRRHGNEKDLARVTERATEIEIGTDSGMSGIAATDTVIEGASGRPSMEDKRVRSSTTAATALHHEGEAEIEIAETVLHAGIATRETEGGTIADTTTDEVLGAGTMTKAGGTMGTIPGTILVANGLRHLRVVDGKGDIPDEWQPRNREDAQSNPCSTCDSTPRPQK